MSEPVEQSRTLLKVQIAGSLVAGPGQLVYAAFILAEGDQTRGLVIVGLGAVMTVALAGGLVQWRKPPSEST